MEKNMMEAQGMNEEKIELTPEMLEKIASGEGGSGYTCKICGKTFMTITSIACHMSSVHK